MRSSLDRLSSSAASAWASQCPIRLITLRRLPRDDRQRVAVVDNAWRFPELSRYSLKLDLVSSIDVGVLWLDDVVVAQLSRVRSISSTMTIYENASHASSRIVTRASGLECLSGTQVVSAVEN